MSRLKANRAASASSKPVASMSQQNAHISSMSTSLEAASNRLNSFSWYSDSDNSGAPKAMSSEVPNDVLQSLTSKALGSWLSK